MIDLPWVLLHCLLSDARILIQSDTRPRHVHPWREVLQKKKKRKHLKFLLSDFEATKHYSNYRKTENCKKLGQAQLYYIQVILRYLKNHEVFYELI